MAFDPINPFHPEPPKEPRWVKGINFKRLLNDGPVLPEPITDQPFHTTPPEHIDSLQGRRVEVAPPWGEGLTEFSSQGASRDPSAPGYTPSPPFSAQEEAGAASRARSLEILEMGSTPEGREKLAQEASLAVLEGTQPGREKKSNLQHFVEGATLATALIPGYAAVQPIMGAARVMAPPAASVIGRLGQHAIQGFKDMGAYALKRPVETVTAEGMANIAVAATKEALEGTALEPASPVLELGAAGLAGGAVSIAAGPVRGVKDFVKRRLFDKSPTETPIRPQEGNLEHTITTAQNHLKNEFEALDQELTNEVARMVRGHPGALEKPEVANRIFAQAFKNTTIKSRRVEKDLWEQIDLEAPIDPTNMRANVAGLIETRLKQGQVHEIDEIRPLLDRILGPEPKTTRTVTEGHTTASGISEAQGVTFNRVTDKEVPIDRTRHFQTEDDIRREASRTVTRSSDSLHPYDTLGQMRSLAWHIRSLSEGEVAGVKAGAVSPRLVNLYNELHSIVHNAIEEAYPNNVALSTASRFSRALHHRYGSGALGQLRAQTPEGLPVVHPEHALSTVLKDPDGALKIAGSPSAELRATAEDVIRAEFKQAVEGSDTVGGPARGAVGGVDLVTRLEPRIRAMAKPAADLLHAGELLSDIVTKRNALVKGAFSRFTGYEGIPNDPQQAVASILNSNNPSEFVTGLIQGFRGDRRAIEGLQQALIDGMFDRGGGTTRGILGVFNEPKFARALEAAYANEPDKFQRLREMALTVRRIEDGGEKGLIARRTILGSLMGAASVTAGLADPFGTGFMIMAPAAMAAGVGGAMLGRHFTKITGSGGTVQVPGIFASSARRMMHKALHQIPPETLFALGVNDPKWERFLLSRAPEDTQGLEIAGKRLRAIIAGMETARANAFTGEEE